MKKLVYLLLLTTTIVFSQTSGITYQAVLYNPNGEELPGYDNIYSPLTDQQVCLHFSIIDQNGNLEYMEEATLMTDSFGMVNTVIGSHIQVDGYASGFNGILWDGNPKSLKVDLDIKGQCTMFEELSNQPFTYVPFALYSANPGNPGPQGEPGQDGVGIASTDDNNDGTFTLNFTDGSSFTTVDLTGEQGEQGEQGVQGEQGPIGPTGATGPQGVQGPPGNDGVDGLDGQDGVGIASTVDNNDGTFTINYTDGSSFTTADLTGPQGPIGPTGLTGPQGVQGPPGNDGVDGLSAYEVWLSLGNTGSEQDFIDSLVGPAGQTGSSFGPNTTNGIFTSNTIGQLTEWVVPDGVYTIEVWLNGSVGGAGGDVINGNTNAVICSGRQGGSFGSVTVILSVVPGDTIGYYIGIDGSHGNDALRFTQTQVFAENGSSGETSQIYRNNILGFRLSGGGGGQGGRVTSSGGCLTISDGGDGSLNMADCLENGFFPRNSTNPYSNQKQTIIIRY